MNEQNDEFIAEPETVTEDKLTKITTTGVDFVVLSNEVKQLENMLELRKKQLKYLGEVEIPELMANARMRELVLANGFRLKIEPVLIVTLPKGNVELADEWLDENGHSGMVKHHLDIHLPKGTPSYEVGELKRFVVERGFEYADNKTIHYQTLNRWGREMDAEGEQIPEDIFKVYRGNTTKISE